VLLRQPLVQLLYQHGDMFNAQSTRLVAWALLWYGAGLVGHCVVEIISRAFYALHDTRTPVLVGMAAMSLNLVFSLAFSALFRSIGWLPHGGLALANSLATGIECVILLVIMRKRLQGLEGKSVAGLVIKSLTASIAMSLGLGAWLAFSLNFNSAVIALGGILVGAGIYGLLIVFLRVEELASAWKAVRSRLHF
jgi:putative peptidoglycan lipid II flippase